MCEWEGGWYVVVLMECAVNRVYVKVMDVGWVCRSGGVSEGMGACVSLNRYQSLYTKTTSMSIVCFVQFVLKANWVSFATKSG